MVDFYEDLLLGKHEAVLKEFSSMMKALDADLDASDGRLKSLQEMKETIMRKDVIDADDMVRKKAIDFDLKSERVTLNKLRDMKLKMLEQVGVLQVKLERWEGEEFMRVMLELVMLITFRYVKVRGDRDGWTDEVRSKVLDRGLKELKDELDRERKRAQDGE